MKSIKFFGVALAIFVIIVSLNMVVMMGCLGDDDDDTSPTPTATETPIFTPTATPTITPTPAPAKTYAEVDIWTTPADVTGNAMVLKNTQTLEEWHFTNNVQLFLKEGPYRLDAYAWGDWYPDVPSQDFYFQEVNNYEIEVTYYYEAQPTPTPTPVPEGNQVGDRAYNFTLDDRNETPHSLHNYVGRVILLDFSAMWCGPCQNEASKAEALYQQYKDQGFIFLTVLIADYQNNAPDAADCAMWADLYGLTFPVLYDAVRDAWNLFNTEGYIPLNLVIDRNMIIRYKETGYNENAIVTMIESLL